MSSEPEPDRIVTLQESIRDLGEKVDSEKAKSAAALGGGVFALLLAAGGAYDLATGNAGVWAAVGLSVNQVYWLTIGLAVLSVLLLATAFVLHRNYDSSRETRLAQMEVELSELIADHARGETCPRNA